MASITRYRSRESAGEAIAAELAALNLEHPYLLAIPRGGIQVAEAVADRLDISLNPLIVKKIPAPLNPEYGIGAVTEDGVKVLNEEVVEYLGINNGVIDEIAERVVSEIQHRKEAFGGLDDEEIGKSDVIIVDDGIATGYSLIAAIKTVKNRNPKSITVAVPVSSYESYYKIKELVDNMICPIVSDEYFFAVANYYDEWFDLTEDQIKGILQRYKKQFD